MRLSYPPAITTYAASMGWIGSRHNAFLSADQVAFFASPSSTPINLGDFTGGTGTIYHHRIIGKGLMNTTIASAVTLGASKAGVDPIAYGIFDPAMILIENIPTEHTFPVLGDGDGTVPYHGAIGLTLPSDDRVYIVDRGQHDALIAGLPALSLGGTRGLLQLLLEGRVCSQPQAPTSFQSQKQVTEFA